MMKIQFAILFVDDLLMSFLLTTLKTSKKRSDARNTALDRKEKSFQWRKNGCCERVIRSVVIHGQPEGNVCLPHISDILENIHNLHNFGSGNVSFS